MKSIFNFQPSPSSPRQRGYSLVEVLVAITVLMIALVGPLTIAHSGLKRSYFSKEQTMSIFLAQEATEAVVKLREDGALAAASFDTAAVWSRVQALDGRCPVGGNVWCGVTVADTGSVIPASFYACNNTNCKIKYQSAARVPYKQGASVAGTDTNYVRGVQIDVEDSHAHVVSAVVWSGGTWGRVELETYVYNIYYEPD
jgi:prepilin-type N-terminal cleavage/methylation domain-containing protein